MTFSTFSNPFSGGFEIQKLGHTITVVFDLSAYTETGFISCFAEPEEAAEFLTYKRGR